MFEPAELELRFGMPDAELPALALEGEGISIRGVIDRVDTWGEHALVRDYKSGALGLPGGASGRTSTGSRRPST